MLRKTMIMPILFGVIIILVALGYGAIFIYLPIPIIFKIVIAIVETSIAGAMVYVLIQRNKELKEEEKDDLSKY